MIILFNNLRIFNVSNGLFNLYLMGRKKKKATEKTARKGIKKELSQQLANQLQNVFNQFGDQSKKSTKAIVRASKRLAKKLTPMAKVDKSAIKKTMQDAYPQASRREMVSSSPAMARSATARNSQPGISKTRAAAPARARVGSPSAKATPALKTPMRKRDQLKVPPPVVSQNFNENQNDPSGPPPTDQT